MATSEILTHRVNHNWRGVLDAWNALDDVEQSTHIMTNSDEYLAVQGAKLQEETHSKLVDLANAEQGRPYVPSDLTAVRKFEYYVDPRNKPGEVVHKVKTFRGTTAQDLENQIKYYMMQTGMLRVVQE